MIPDRYLDPKNWEKPVREAVQVPKPKAKDIWDKLKDVVQSGCDIVSHPAD
jgi:hypothetical protein